MTGRPRRGARLLQAAARGRMAALLALAAVAGAGCGGAKGSTLVIVVIASGSPPPVYALEVHLSTTTAALGKQTYTNPEGGALTLPTTLAALLPARAVGDGTIDVTALNQAGGIVAHGTGPLIALRAGETRTVSVRLECNGQVCTGATGDGGAPGDGGDGGAPPDGRDRACGNGRIDRGETCDTAIPAGQPGACPPPGCSDGIPCTEDVAVGDGCTATCVHTVVAALTAGDGCCPQGATASQDPDRQDPDRQDPDCSATCGNGTIEPGETCDLMIAAGQGGACPRPADCDDGDPCTVDQLISGGTCDAQCTHTPIAAPAAGTPAAPDGCCPAGAAHADDADCPIVCGNGLVEAGETCDIGAPPSATGACPTSCDDGDPCTRDVRLGDGCNARCMNIPITTFAPGDGCCPAGGTRNADSDCPAACGNGAVEAGETCDRAIASGPGACPTACPSPSLCVRRRLVGDAAHCSARCTTDVVTTCSAISDGCCPAGCTAPGDPDCSPTCGDGHVDADAPAAETCDIAVAAGSPGACPQSCPACTHLLIGGGTCQAQCLFLPVTDLRPGDGCCPAGGTFDRDADCAPVCGNGVSEPPFETCDSPAAPDACTAKCPDNTACTTYRMVGSAGTCDQRCTVATQITACQGGDGCCPPGCSSVTDSDCAPVCGNGLLEAGERCDRGITAGKPGACDPSCDDLDPCTADFSSGTVEGCSRACTHVPITACTGGDRCCPRGCGVANDRDCAGVCGDSQVAQGETCDPPATCPIACPDDGDRCTTDRLIGDPLLCTAACVHTPITACSGTRVDLCCPTGCDPTSDIDC